MSLDKFMDCTYDRINYNCGHFACDVWKDITGEDISAKMLPLIECLDVKKIPIRAKNQFVKLDKKESPCLVLMRSITSSLHIGVYHNGNIIHLREDSVTENLPFAIATRLHRRLGFYK